MGSGGLKSIAGSASLKANDFVQAFQNPFGAQISQIFDPIDAAKKAGTLKYEDVSGALDQFNQQWTGFDEAAQQFKGKGGDYKTVVDQAYDPKQDFMKTVESVRSNLTSWADELKPADAGKPKSDATAPPAMQTILTSLGLTPEGSAASAADKQKKRATGTPSTILTGGRGLPELSAANRQYKTLLGY